MGTTGDQDVIQAFFSDGANPAFGEGIGIRRLKRGMDNVDTFRLKDSIKSLAEFGIVVVDQETSGSSASW